MRILGILDEEYDRKGGGVLDAVLNAVSGEMLVRGMDMASDGDGSRRKRASERKNKWRTMSV